MAKSQSESLLPEPSCHCEEPRLPRTFQVLAMTKGHREFAEGKQEMLGPGRRTIAKSRDFSFHSEQAPQSLNQRAA
jgi:hypothetical protein